MGQMRVIDPPQKEQEGPLDTWVLIFCHICTKMLTAERLFKKVFIFLCSIEFAKKEISILII